jgi:hypothetical protein
MVNANILPIAFEKLPGPYVKVLSMGQGTQEAEGMTLRRKDTVKEAKQREELQQLSKEQSRI